MKKKVTGKRIIDDIIESSLKKKNAYILIYDKDVETSFSLQQQNSILKVVNNESQLFGPTPTLFIHNGSSLDNKIKIFRNAVNLTGGSVLNMNFFQ